MATITLTIPDAVAPEVVDALCARGGYDDVPDPKPPRAAFAKGVVIDFVRTVYRHYKGEAAGNAARLSALAQADAAAQIT